MRGGSGDVGVEVLRDCNGNRLLLGAAVVK